MIKTFLDPVIVYTPKQYLLYKEQQKLVDLERKKEAYLKRYNKKANEIIDAMLDEKSVMPSDLTRDQHKEYSELFKEHRKLWDQNSLKVGSKEVNPQ